MDAPAVVALVGVEDLELGKALDGYFGDSQAVFVDPTRRQCRVDTSTQAASDIGRQPGSILGIPPEMDVVLDATDLPGQQLEAKVNGSHVAGEWVATGHPVVDVDLAAGHIEVLVLQFRELDLGVDLLVIVAPVVTDARDVR